MEKNQESNDQFFVTFADIISVFRESLKKILVVALAVGFLGVIAALLKPISYQAEGTFREKGIKSNAVGTSSSIMQFLSGGTISSESEATSLMTSRKILKEVIDSLHLQARLEPIAEIETSFRLIKKNLGLLWNAWMKPLYPPLKDVHCPLKIEALNYSGEIPLVYLLDFKEDGSYEVTDIENAKQSLGWGRLGEPFVHQGISFIIESVDKSFLAQPYSLVVDSVTNIVKQMNKFLQVEPTKLDKSLLKLKYEHRNRHLSSDIINAIMLCYQKYLKNYHQDIALQQLDYLGTRRDRLRDNLVDVMQKHANFLAHDLYSSGFIESDKEMDFLAKSLHDYKQKLLDKELEIRRLENIKPNNFSYFDPYSSGEGDSAIINNIFGESRALKQRRDALEIELQKKSRQQGINLQKSFEQQFNELIQVQLYLEEIGEVISQFQRGVLPNANFKLVNDSRFLLNEWFERLHESKNENSANKQDIKDNFQFYLNNLQRLFEVHERILQERLVHQQNPSEEYQGISLEAATELFLDYSKQLIRMEAEIRQNLFFIHQIDDPNFEITSLSAGLEDSVSRDMIRKASDLILHLRDQNNQSLREQERIKEELSLQRTFLRMHLQQMVHLMELNKQLIDEKIFALQNVSLELIHQRISLLEKNLQDYLQSRLGNLEQERTLIKHHLESIHNEMALLPQKWVSEQLLMQEVDTNQLIVEEIAKLVESKNISHNLDVIQSAPVDLAIPSVHPYTPKVFAWGMIGFLLGGTLTAFFILGKALYHGVKVSTQNLEMIGHHVSGTIRSTHSSLHDAKYALILQRLKLYFGANKQTDQENEKLHAAKQILLLEGQGPHYTPDFASILRKNGQRILTIDLRTKEESSSSTTLIHYLNGEISHLPIEKVAYGDVINAGLSSYHYATDLTRLSVFQKLLQELSSKYDWILAVSNALPCSIEAESLLPLFPNIAVTLKQETIEKIGLFTYFLKNHHSHKLTFILYDD